MTEAHDTPALARAIADPPDLPGVRQSSDLDGLSRRTVRPMDLVGTSVAVIAPSASALSIPFVLPMVIGPGAWVSAVLGFAVAGLLASVFSQFAVRVAAAGSLYTWVTRSLGPLAGIVVGASMLVGYLSLVCFGVSQAIRTSADAVSSATNHDTTLTGSAQWLVGVAIVLACVLVSVRGVGFSTRVALVAEAVLIAALLVLAVMTLGREGLPSLDTFSLAGADWWQILVGATIVMGITIGFEASAALASEVERPFLSVPRAMSGSLGLTALLYVIAFLAASSVTEHEGTWVGPAQRWFPAEVDAHVGDAALGFLLAAAFISLALGAMNCLARVIFSFAREGLLPAFLGTAHRRWGSPTGALLVIAPLALLPATITLLRGDEVGTIALRLLSAAVDVLVVAYALVALALPVFLRRLDELTLRPVLLAIATGVIASGLAVVDVYEDVQRGQLLPVSLAAASLVGAGVWYLALRRFRRDEVDGMGIHDETIASDLL